MRAAAAGEPTGKFCATEVMSGIDGMAAAHRRRASDSSQRSGTKREERGRLPYVILAAAIRCGPACSPNPLRLEPQIARQIAKRGGQQTNRLVPAVAAMQRCYLCQPKAKLDHGVMPAAGRLSPRSGCAAPAPDRPGF